MLIYLLIFIATLLFIFIKRHYTQWQRLGLITDEPNVPFGSLRQVFLRQRHFGLIISDIYQKFQEKIVGVYIFFKPTILIRDAALVRRVLTSDFGSFHDRGLYVDEKNDPMSANIFALQGQKWRQLRIKLNPSFSTCSLKRMFDTADDVANRLKSYVDEQLKDGETHMMEFKNLFTTYSVDIIGSVIFGLEIDSFTHPDNEFRMLVERIFHKAPLLERIRTMGNFTFPPLSHLLARLGIRDPITYRIRDIVKHTIEFREENNVVRKDLLQSLIELKNAGLAEGDEPMSIDVIAANSFFFYIAGSDTTATTISFTLYELAMYPELMARAQQEVDECLEKHNLTPQGRYTYEFVQDLKFLDLCVMETTRKYPGLPVLNRECTKDFQVPDTDFIIRKGTPVIISLFGIHRDEQYFPSPMDYKPDRFTEENKDYDPVAFFPFGEGPHHCIGLRLGTMNVKLAVAKILANFNVHPLPRKEVEFRFHTVPVLVPEEEIKVAMSKRW